MVDGPRIQIHPRGVGPDPKEKPTSHQGEGVLWDAVSPTPMDAGSTPTIHTYHSHLPLLMVVDIDMKNSLLLHGHRGLSSFFLFLSLSDA